MQGQVPPLELGKVSVDKVMKDLQGGKLQAIDDLARTHASYISSRGVQGGPHVAINGQLNPVEGHPMVCGPLSWTPPSLVAFWHAQLHACAIADGAVWATC